MDAQEAASMLAAANSGAQPVSQDAAAPAVAPASSEPQTSPASVEPGATAPDSFSSLDPSSLAPDLQVTYKEMQADYTRKTQALAEQRKQFEGVDLDSARQAIQFVESLNSDPQYALQVHAQLSQALQQAGLSPAQADAAAAQQMDTQDDGMYAPDEYDGVSPEIKAQLQELQSWKSEQEQLQQQQYWMGELTRQEMAIRQSNPEYTDSDMETVYALAHAHQGDLMKAQEQYAGLRNQLVSQYINAKAQVPANGPPAQSGFTPPARGLTFEQADKAAHEHLRQVLGSQG